MPPTSPTQILQRETIAPNADHSGWRASHDQGFFVRIEAAGVAGIDQPALADFDMGQPGLFDAGREGVLRHHGTAHGDCAGLGAADFGNDNSVGCVTRGEQRAKWHWARPAVCAPGAGTSATSPKSATSISATPETLQAGLVASRSGARQAAMIEAG
jgi:hypothetical protein